MWGNWLGNYALSWTILVNTATTVGGILMMNSGIMNPDATAKNTWMMIMVGCEPNLI